MSDKKVKKEPQDKCTSYPIAVFIFSMYVFAFVLAVVSGGILIEASMSHFVANDAYEAIEEISQQTTEFMESDSQDLKYL